MNDTFKEFHDFLMENSERIRSELVMSEDSPLKDLYSDAFRRNYILHDEELQPVSDVSATDSSEFVRELYNGKKLILIRGYTLYRGEIFSSFIPSVTEVSREHVQAFLTMLMEHSEHHSILNMLKSKSPGYILVDGSFSGRIMRKSSRLDAEGFNKFREEYMRTLVNLIEKSEEKGIPMVFISKGSESRKFKRLLLKEILKTNPEIDKESIPDS
jgi:hypothetical protein